jgi:septal ring factor EnvC (AmiA/AmiB activator)
LAGRLTARVTDPPQTATESGPDSNPEEAQLRTEITSYQQQVSQEQNTLASLDARMKEVQSQIQQSEQDSKLALAELSKISAETKTAPSQETNRPTEAEQVSAPKPEPAPPWYMKVWKWFH